MGAARAHISRVHAQIRGHEGQGEKDDGDGCEDEDRFVV